MNDNDAEKYFVFMHRDLQYALPVRFVLEIIETPTLLPFHGTLPGCLGNVVHRNYLLPVLDPTLLCTRRDLKPVLPKILVVIRDGDAVYALAMDRFVAFVPLDATKAQSVNDDGSQEDSPFVETVRAFQSNTLIVLSAATIVRLVKKNLGSQQLMTNGEVPQTVPGQGGLQLEGRIVEGRIEGQIYLCAHIERALFGIPVEQVLEVLEGYDVTPLFQMPPLVRGLINLRGQVLACVDISGDLGFQLRALEERNQFVVLREDGAELALCVDKVAGIRRLSPERIHKTELILSGNLTRYAAGVIEEEDGALFVLSVPAVFGAPQLQAYRRQEG